MDQLCGQFEPLGKWMVWDRREQKNKARKTPYEQPADEAQYRRTGCIESFWKCDFEYAGKKRDRKTVQNQK